MSNDKPDDISPTYFMNKDFYHPDHDPRVHYRNKIKEKYKKDFGRVHRYFMVEEAKTPQEPIKAKFPKYHNRYSLLDAKFEPPKKEKYSRITPQDLPSQFSDHQILRMLKVGQNAIFGNDIKDMKEIRTALERRDFPYHSEKDYLPKKKADLQYRNYYQHPGFKPIPHNVRSTANMLNIKTAQDTYISDSVKNMGVGPSHFVSGVGRDDDKYIKHGYGNRRMY